MNHDEYEYQQYVCYYASERKRESWLLILVFLIDLAHLLSTQLLWYWLDGYLPPH